MLFGDCAQPGFGDQKPLTEHIIHLTVKEKNNDVRNTVSACE